MRRSGALLSLAKPTTVGGSFTSLVDMKLEMGRYIEIIDTHRLVLLVVVASSSKSLSFRRIKWDIGMKLGRNVLLFFK